MTTTIQYIYMLFVGSCSSVFGKYRSSSCFGSLSSSHNTVRTLNWLMRPKMKFNNETVYYTHWTVNALHVNACRLFVTFNLLVHIFTGTYSILNLSLAKFKYRVTLDQPRNEIDNIVHSVKAWNRRQWQKKKTVIKLAAAINLVSAAHFATGFPYFPLHSFFFLLFYVQRWHAVCCQVAIDLRFHSIHFYVHYLNQSRT